MSDEFEETRLGPMKITNRMRTLVMIREYDLEAQLAAIKGVLHRNRQGDDELEQEIKKLESEFPKSDGAYWDHLTESWFAHIHCSAFQDAAHSMSAVGMLAPFVESLFVAVFEGLRPEARRSDGASDTRRSALDDAFWDPHYVLDGAGRRRDIAGGIKQLSDSAGLTPFLPDDFADTLDALFMYRNKMFHHGFEWPLEERVSFEKSIREKRWPPEWITKWTTESPSSDEPWIFLLSGDFIQHCLVTIDQVLEGVGAFLTQRKETETAKPALNSK